ncbi:pilus assembly protein [Alsobacter sp. SYSU M60028]|uniref:Pilus assembly protein n=1 Tax=Alsobacter ponti TaxID=2962936 RepID=A0ABT1L9W7_9HYPH|nr:TadE/TadG family type IV pilus assembly protein [Alsobacter ponti]MCP8937858.1 pilus assembly protein [Alsobacter ponti]
MIARTLRFAKDSSGAAMVEFSIVLVITLLLTGGVIETLFAFWQWNSAMKAVERGARIAAVSNPVPQNLVSSWASYLPSGKAPGDPVPAGVFDILCTGGGTTYATLTASCSPTTWGAGSKDAMARIFFGRPDTPATTTFTCSSANFGPYSAGICDLFPRATPSNVQVRYQATGLGFYGNPNGPTPTVTVKLRNLQFDYVFIKGLAGIVQTLLPDITATVTGEDLNSAAPS